MSSIQSHLRLAGADPAAQDSAARQIIERCPPLMAALRALEGAELPDAWLVSGAIYGNIWNALSGRAWDYGVKDYDVFYFDASDLSYEAEDAVIRRWTPAFAAHPPVEIRNQARVPLWYEDHFGRPYPPLSSSREAIDRFACTTHCVGARMIEGELDLYAPYGLDEIFSFRLTPNPLLDNRETHERKALRQTACWPELEVVPWPDGPNEVRLVTTRNDWSDVMSLLQDAFAFMEGRIDPASSLIRWTNETLEAEAAKGFALIVDGPKACAFLKQADDALYVGKIAVASASRGQGLMRALIERASLEARHRGFRKLRLETRIELTENHAAFAAVGFVKVAETAHPGYDRPTSITMEKSL